MRSISLVYSVIDGQFVPSHIELRDKVASIGSLVQRDDGTHALTMTEEDFQRVEADLG